MQLLSGSATKTSWRVSSILSRDHKANGAQHMFDGTDITCWTSDHGTPQHVLLTFHRIVHVRQVHVMFQGGFVGEDVRFLARTTESPVDFVPLPVTVHFTDSNAMQAVDVSCDNATHLLVVFGRSSDFYGRVTIYKLAVWGHECK
ncbi:hypothetical protein H310_01839 [Aphanomyces invadans]|uniref:F5/8 type C domain-containing protein n=1 Tax=Aphanomyces invadans TaxID=157072 RepID=A0A024UM66_9STRA|nr:hypothetical protein H310_01839 [Aphanomyces invadans]ETW07280.1 hypothetical protein H310_01839 [Aphanomyces invadans]|eukprot:XP_008863373.1 hypothetical protein H310_01839 [Aphanomyces invadans]